MTVNVHFVDRDEAAALNPQENPTNEREDQIANESAIEELRLQLIHARRDLLESQRAYKQALAGKH